MKNKIKILVLLLALLALGVTGAIPTSAQEGVPGPENTEEEAVSLSECPTIMNAFIKEEEGAFMTFLNDHFQNELENSLLLEDAMNRYRLADSNLTNKLNEFTTQGSIPEVLAGQSACQQLIDDSMERMRSVLKEHVTATAHGKKALKITDKYKAINEKLRNLNFQMAEMRAYFYSFNNALPSYTEKCGS